MKNDFSCPHCKNKFPIILLLKIKSRFKCPNCNQLCALKKKTLYLQIGCIALFGPILTVTNMMLRSHGMAFPLILGISFIVCVFLYVLTCAIIYFYGEFEDS